MLYLVVLQRREEIDIICFLEPPSYTTLFESLITIKGIQLKSICLVTVLTELLRLPKVGSVDLGIPLSRSGILHSLDPRNFDAPLLD